MKRQKPKILIYDIETCLLALWGFSLGKQVLRHGQLLRGYFFRTHVICITYKWAHEKTVHCLDWGESEEDELNMIKAFDELIKEADIVLGKNSNRFDNKHINTNRLIYDLPGMPDWVKYTDDLETQMRKYLYLPSYSLEYFAELMGVGSKDKMEFSDWTSIATYRMIQCNTCKTKESRSIIEWLFGTPFDKIVLSGEKALKKMFTYGKKDTLITDKLRLKCFKQFEWKFNMQTFYNAHVCRYCGSENVSVDRDRVASGQTKYKRFYCNEHKGYAGRAYISQKTGKLGKLS